MHYSYATHTKVCSTSVTTNERYYTLHITLKHNFKICVYLSTCLLFTGGEFRNQMIDAPLVDRRTTSSKNLLTYGRVRNHTCIIFITCQSGIFSLTGQTFTWNTDPRL